MNNNIFLRYLTGVVCVLAVVAVVIGILYAVGVFDKKKLMPITYPDKSVNWVSTSDDVIRASFDKKLKINIDTTELFANVEINGISELNTPHNAVFSKNRNANLPYALFVCDEMYISSENNEEEYKVSMKIYVGATLSNSAEVVEGKGFVFEVTSLNKIINQETGECAKADLKSMHIYSLTEQVTQKLL